MKTAFSKMHGLGNDFVVIRASESPALSPEEIRSLSDRRRGIGFDQLLWLEPPVDDAADVRYRIFNADGAEAEQCGNGARCIARLLAGPDATDGTFRLAHAGGISVARIVGSDVTVALGEPDFDPARIPLVAEADAPWYTFDTGEAGIRAGAVSIGNPHAVSVVDDVDEAPVSDLGPLLEQHARFPNRANIGFMQIVDRDHVRLRVYERGVGETSACGTGACAAVAIGRRNGLLGQKVSVDLPGGVLQIEWTGPGDDIWLGGEAVMVFEGEVDL